MTAVKQFMSKVWNHIALPDLYYHNEGYFHFARCKSEDDRNKVLENGPYSIFFNAFVCEKMVS